MKVVFMKIKHYFVLSYLTIPAVTLTMMNAVNIFYKVRKTVYEGICSWSR